MDNWEIGDWYWNEEFGDLGIIEESKESYMISTLFVSDDDPVGHMHDSMYGSSYLEKSVKLNIILTSILYAMVIVTGKRRYHI